MMAGIRRACVAVIAALIVLAGPLLAQDRRDIRMSGLFIGLWSVDLGPGADGNNRFDLSRAYLTLSGRLSERVTGRITTDAIREDGEELEVRLKYAFATYQPGIPGVAIRFGLTQTPFVEYEEALWEHRMQGSVPADRLRFLSSADLGLAADGVWGEGERLQVTAGVYNGEGWNQANTDAGKDLMVRATVRLAGSDDPGPLGGLRLTGYGQVGSPTGGGTRQRGLGMLAWRGRQVTVATQVLMTRDRTDGDGGEAGDPVEGVLAAGFVVIKIPRSTAVLIGRVERFDPDRAVDGNWQTRWTGGIGVRLAPELRLLGSLEHLRYEGGAPTPALDAARIRALAHVALTF